MNALLLQFFSDELVKLASGSSDTQRNYYMRNRSKILQQQKAYRMQHAPMISKKQKVYRNKVKSGVLRQRERHSTGNSYTYGGYR
jgi:hypothetical protein